MRLEAWVLTEDLELNEILTDRAEKIQKVIDRF